MIDTPKTAGTRIPGAEELFLDCVHCGLCLQACPTYTELGTEMDSPRGRIHLIRALDEGSLPLTADVERHLDLCLGCRACETACPSGVRYGALIERAREHTRVGPQRTVWKRLRDRAIAATFPFPSRLKLLLTPLRWLQRLGLATPLAHLVPAIALLPRLDDWTPIATSTAPVADERHRVALLSGCVAQVVFANTNHATARVLARNGCRVLAPPEQGCCGALYLHAGDRDAARACARRNIDVFDAQKVDAVVVNAAGCGAAMKEYGELLEDDPGYADRARALGSKVRDVTEYLAKIGVAAPQGRIDARVTYHDACHLAHGQGVRRAPRELLRAIPGLELVELEEADTCCGSAGSYNLTEPDMAGRLGERKASHVRQTGASIVAAANPGCVMQIAAALRRDGVSIEVVHPVELLDRAYDAAT